MNESLGYPKFRWLIMIAAIFGYISMQITVLSFAPILPQIAQDLNIHIGGATHLMTAFLLSSTIAFFIAGPLCDRFGIMSVITIGLLCAAVPASLMPWIGITYSGALSARLVEGFSSGFLISAMGPIIAVWFPPREKGLAAGLMGASVSVGSAIGVTAGPAVFVATGSWRLMSAWLSMVGWAGLVFVLILQMVPKPQPLFMSDTSTGEKIGKESFKDSLFSRMTMIGFLVAFMAGWSLQCLYNQTPAFLSADQPLGAGFGPIVSGQLVLAVMFAGIIGPIIGGLLVDRFFHGNVKPVMIIGFGFCCLFVYMTKLDFIYSFVPFLLISLVISGIAVQFVYPSMYVYIAKAYSVHVLGKMSALWSAMGGFGGAVGVFVGGFTANRFGNYDVSITFAALSSLAGILFVLLLPKLSK